MLLSGCTLALGDGIAGVSGFSQEERVPDYLESAWLCLNGSGPLVDDLTTAAPDNLRCELDLQFTDTSLIASANGIPNHDFASSLGLYGYDASGAVAEMTSSYRLKAGGGNGYNGIDDWEYVAGLGDLDECNGHFGPTPQAPEGIYHYHSTRVNGAGGLGFPYFLLCYHGVADTSNFNPGGQGNGRGGPPPPPPGG